jgi:DNA polymerase III subunit gamma/tau
MLPANLASKYRPQLLRELIGQETVVDVLVGMLESGNISRTLLVAGPWGSGKTTVARILARYVNCLGERDNMAQTPCGKCEACLRMDRGTLTDYMEINAADARGIDDVRSLIEQVRYKPQSKFRVVVLDEVHQLTPQAFQALLKILEEPPSATIFVLCTTDPGKLPPATRSRCKKLIIQQVPPEKTVKILRRAVRGEGVSDEQIPDELLLAVATAVNGHPRDALMAVEALLDRVKAKGGLDNLGDLKSLILDIADQVAGESQDAIVGNFLFGIYTGKYTRAMLALKGVSKHDVFADVVMQYHKQTMFFRLSKKLQDKMYVDWYDKVNAEMTALVALENPNADPGELAALVIKKTGEVLSPAALGRVLSILVDVIPRVKRYEFDPEYLLMDVVVRSIAAMQGL